MTSLFKLTASCLILAVSSTAFAETLSDSGLASQIVQGQEPLGMACGPVTLTQTTSQTVTAGSSVHCGSGGLHADNSYFRAFSLGAFPTGFSVCGISMGIELADASGTGTTQPITVRIYSNTGGAFPAGTLTQVGSTTEMVADQNLTILNVPVTGTVPAGAELVAEVFSPDGQMAGHSFFIGANGLGQTNPGYITAAACGINSPASLTSIGFPNAQIVLNVIGADAAGQGNLTFTPADRVMAFGNQAVNSTSSATMTLGNTGTGELNITELTAPAAPFARTGGTCSATLPITIAAGASCTLVYSFSPTAAISSAQTLTVTADSPGSNTINLTGTGFVVAPIPAGSDLTRNLLLAMLLISGLVVVALRRR